MWRCPILMFCHRKNRKFEQRKRNKTVECEGVVGIRSRSTKSAQVSKNGENVQKMSKFKHIKSLHCSNSIFFELVKKFYSPMYQDLLKICSKKVEYPLLLQEIGLFVSDSCIESTGKVNKFK